MFKITSLGEGKSFSFTKSNFLGTILAVIFILIVWAWYSNPLVVTVTGIGEIAVPPENALVSFIVSSASSDVSVAVGGVDSKITQIKSALSSFGISDEDISQTQVNVVPPSLVGGGGIDYSATVTMAVKVSDYSMVNALISTLYSKGVSYVSQPVLSVENSDDLEKEALGIALKDAGKKANQMALKSLKLFRKKIALTQVSTPAASSTTTKTAQAETTEEGNLPSGDTFKVTKVVSVTYKMW